MMTPKEYFEEKVPKNLQVRKEKLAEINAIYEFQISGDCGGTWTLDLTVAGPTVSSGSSGKAHCTISMEDEDFMKMIAGELNPQMAFMTRKLKVAGNMGLALKLSLIL